MGQGVSEWRRARAAGNLGGARVAGKPRDEWRARVGPIDRTIGLDGGDSRRERRRIRLPVSSL